MFATPPQNAFPDAVLRRGRSRQVASSAMARLASDERIRAAEAVKTIQANFFIPITDAPEPDADDDYDEDDEDEDVVRGHGAVRAGSRRVPCKEPTLTSSSHASSSPTLGYQSQRSSFSSIQSALSTPSSSSTMISIASPIPLKAAMAPPFMRSASSSPPSSASMSPDYYDSPPSPPETLEDQVHRAYAREEIRLAKILLLRVKGYEITSDDDPRIDDITDDDFHSFFVPGGRLMDETDEKVVQELQARERAAYEQRRRLERLKDCGRKWELEKQRMRDERLAVLRRREKKVQEEEARRRAAEREKERLAEEERQQIARERALVEDMHHKVQRSRSRKVVSYRFLQTPITNTQPKQYVYDFPGGPTRIAKPTPIPLAPAPVPQRPTFDDSCSVTFMDVLSSMQGPLFPTSHADRPRRTESPALSRSTSRTHSQTKRRRDARLLEALLVDIEYTVDERRKQKGKQRQNQPRIFAPCLACSTASSPQSSLTSSLHSIRRTSSWLSFRGTVSSSASSSTTDLTTPPSSPIPPSKTPWFVRPKSTLTEAVLPPAILHSCHQRTRLAPIPLSDTPLYMDPPPPTRLEPLSHPGRQRSTSTARAAREGAGVLVRRMSKFVELAKGIQTAYASAALFTVSASYDGIEDRPPSPGPSLEDAVPPPRQRASRPKLRPAGYRARARDVAKLLGPAPDVVGSPVSDANSLSHSSMGRYIPLMTPFKPTEVPRTVLPDPLPYPLVFKRVLSPSRSPFRFHALSELHTMYPSSAPSPPHMTGQVTWRIRSVGNPVHMRLKALRNRVRQEGLQWEGSGSDTALGGGRERVIGVAYENIGPTQLNLSALN